MRATTFAPGSSLTRLPPSHIVTVKCHLKESIVGGSGVGGVLQREWGLGWRGPRFGRPLEGGSSEEASPESTATTPCLNARLALTVSRRLRLRLHQLHRPYSLAT